MVAGQQRSQGGYGTPAHLRSLYSPELMATQIKSIMKMGHSSVKYHPG
jgi:hypothetical protein